MRQDGFLWLVLRPGEHGLCFPSKQALIAYRGVSSPAKRVPLSGLRETTSSNTYLAQTPRQVFRKSVTLGKPTSARMSRSNRIPWPEIALWGPLAMWMDGRW